MHHRRRWRPHHHHQPRWSMHCSVRGHETSTNTGFHLLAPMILGSVQTALRERPRSLAGNRARARSRLVQNLSHALSSHVLDHHFGRVDPHSKAVLQCLRQHSMECVYPRPCGGLLQSAVHHCIVGVVQNGSVRLALHRVVGVPVAGESLLKNTVKLPCESCGCRRPHVLLDGCTPPFYC